MTKRTKMQAIKRFLRKIYLAPFMVLMGCPEGDPPSPSEPTPTPTPAPEGITLTKEEFAQLNTNLAMMQRELEELRKPKEPETPSTPPSYANKSIDQLNNAELVDLVVNHINQSTVQPLLNTIMQLSIKEEMRDLGDKYEDFKKDDKVREAVYGIAEKNTHLSLEQAYLIHKGKLPTPTPAPVPTPTSAVPTPIPGERPAVAASTVGENKGMSVREAAEAAFKQLKYNDPT